MPSKLQLVNRALSELGRLAVTSINESSDAQYLAAKIDELYPEVLLECNWTWAVIYRRDDTPLSANFSPDYTYTYQLPGDFGKFYRFASTGTSWGIYAFMDDMLLANTKPVEYYYISNQAAYETLPPLFSRSLILYAAAKAAPTLTNNMQLAAYLQNEYVMIKTKAILENDMERAVTSMPYNDFDRITLV